ncbi:MAG TPA: BlaI/MecI/CopY family transcriptional regulator [Terriglobales bacterium]|nr:BlaI/MecI/CopY family transcriptional regulator [Terriglobales bacterium]
MLSFGKSLPAPAPELGPLESQVMEILWRQGAANVREVIQRMPRPLAYTTVMTTLDRLFKKGLLERNKPERAFVYAPTLSRAQWARRQAGEFMASFLSGPRPARAALLSCLLEAVEEFDAALLEDLGRQIEAKRRTLGAAPSPLRRERQP